MMMRELKPLSEVIEWKRPFWMGNYFKTVCTSILITGCITSIIEAISLKNNLLVVFGVILFVLGIIEPYIVDKYCADKKKEELDAIDERINYTNERLDNFFNELYDEKCDEFIKKLEEERNGEKKQNK